MIVEVAEISAKTGSEAQFEAGVSRAAPLFLRAKGCHGVALHRVVETPHVYRLLVGRPSTTTWSASAILKISRSGGVSSAHISTARQR